MKKQYCIFKGIEGFGDRLQYLLQSIEYCKHTNRILVIDWRDSNWQQEKIDHIENYFSIENIKTETISNFIENHKEHNIFPESWHGNIATKEYENFIKNTIYLHKNPEIFREIIKSKKQDFNEDIVVCTNIGFRSFKYNFFFHINFHDNILKEIQKTLDKHKLQNNLYNCIHIRNKNKEWVDSIVKNKRLKQDMKESFNDEKKYFDFLYKEYTKRKSQLQVVIVSDDMEASNLFNKNYFNENAIELIEENIDTQKLCGIHKVKFEDKDKKRKINIKAIVDFHIMLYSKHLICDKISTFSLMAERIKSCVNHINDKSLT